MIRQILLVFAVLNPFLVFSQTFVNVAEQQGIDISVSDNEYGGGVSFYDFNKDGWDDLTFSETNGYIEIYLNQAGVLQQLPNSIYGYGKTKHVLWVDFDNDGDSDLLVTADMSPLRLFENTGNFNFVDITENTGLSQVLAHTHGASFGDFNNDGLLDLYLSNYEFIGEVDNPADYYKLNKLYRNNGDGTFTDITLQAGVEDGITMSFGSVWIDYDKDGWQDIYVINDKTDNNTLYHNNGDGTFSDVSTISLAGIVIDAMTATVGDYNNDAELDIYVTNTPGGNRLLRGNTGDSFTDVSESIGDILDGYSWGAVWIDYDNNGFEDLYVATYNPSLPPQENEFYVNDGNGSFTNDNSIFYQGNTAKSVCPAIGDLNNDGFSDIAVHNLAPNPAIVWRNLNNGSNFLKVTLEGVVSNRDGIGSWITVYCGDDAFTKYTMCGQNYLGQDSQHKIFGLGSHTVVDSVKVEWLSGMVDNFYGLEANQSITIAEGSSISPEITFDGDASICSGDTLTLNLAGWSNVSWSNGSTSETILVNEPGQYSAEVEYLGMTFLSDTVMVEVLPPPAIDYQIDNVSCFGFDNGQVSISNNSGMGIDTVIWQNPDFSGTVASNLSPGLYQVEVIDMNGCRLSSAFEIEEPDSIYAELTTTDQIDGFPGTAEILSITGGVSPYFIFWSNGLEQETAIEGLIPDNYFLQITDTQNCTDTTFFTISNLTGLPNYSRSTISIHPNPAIDHVTVQNLSNAREIRVFHSSGEEVAKQLISREIRRTTVNLEELPPGLYFLHVLSKNEQAYFRLIIQ
ncbi:FG-GAP-like repeat-containing protein [Halocola ammonii]